MVYIPSISVLFFQLTKIFGSCYLIAQITYYSFNETAFKREKVSKYFGLYCRYNDKTIRELLMRTFTMWKTSFKKIFIKAQTETNLFLTSNCRAILRNHRNNKKRRCLGRKGEKALTAHAA